MATSSDQSIIVFDVETTGLSTSSDQIIEISIQRGLAPESPRWTKRFKPSVPITRGAHERHGIRPEDLEGRPAFAEHAAEILGFFDEATVIAGYNVGFDLDILGEEVKRAGLVLDLADKTVVDAFRLWQRFEQRTLGDAVLRFLGQKHEGAHSAERDVAATAKVLAKMLEEFGIADQSWQEIGETRSRQREAWIGPTHHFQWKDGQPVFAFGKKHRGELLLDVKRTDAQHVSWLWAEAREVPPHVKQICRAVQLAEPEAFLNWLMRFSPPSSVAPEARAEMIRQAHEQLQAWEKQRADEGHADLDDLFAEEG